jgi:hypothetical protein
MAEANRPAMILTDLDLPTFDNLLSLLSRSPDLGKPEGGNHRHQPPAN